MLYELTLNIAKEFTYCLKTVRIKDIINEMTHLGAYHPWPELLLKIA